MKREQIAEQFGDDVLLLDPPEQFDDCILGMEPVAVYDEEKVLEALVNSGMSEDEAAEWYSFNIVGAYVGERTPMFLSKPREY